MLGLGSRCSSTYEYMVVMIRFQFQTHSLKLTLTGRPHSLTSARRMRIYTRV